MSDALEQKRRIDLGQSNYDLLIHLLLDEITFLTTCFNHSCKTEDEQTMVRAALKKLERLLKIQGRNPGFISENELRDLTAFVLDTIGQIIDELGKHGENEGLGGDK